MTSEEKGETRGAPPCSVTNAGFGERTKGGNSMVIPQQSVLDWRYLLQDLDDLCLCRLEQRFVYFTVDAPQKWMWACVYDFAYQHTKICLWKTTYRRRSVGKNMCSYMYFNSWPQ